MSDSEEFKNYQERDEAVHQLMATEGWRLQEKMNLLGVSTFIFHKNFNELINGIRFFKSGEALLLVGVGSEDELNNYLQEMTRLLHNCVASVMTMVEHTRIFVRELYVADKFAEFNREYEAKIEANFKENPLHQFIQGLRNFILHQGLPVVGGRLNLNELKTDLMLDFAELKKSNHWNVRAKEFLADKKDSEELESIIFEYRNLITAFHDWFYDRQTDLHKEEFEESDKLRERIHNSRWTPKY